MMARQHTQHLQATDPKETICTITEAASSAKAIEKRVNGTATSSDACR